ncbi:MAG: isocitrate lyase/PEP mutase family protein, partial [Hyphomicrobiales bacterium]
KILTQLGFDALATTSAGFAFTIGRKDWPGSVKRDEALAHARELVSATHLPMNADFENGYADTSQGVAETVTLAAQTGLAGCSIEDTTGDHDKPIFEFSEAVERVAAACQAARALDRDFILTARAENFLHDRPNMDDTLKRLNAFAEVGADVLYAPGLGSIEQIRTLCSSVPKPVNVIIGEAGVDIRVTDLQEAGVSRISIGSAFARVALNSLLECAREVRDKGTFSFARKGASFEELDAFMD